jgi:hypothetical protein
LSANHGCLPVFPNNPSSAITSQEIKNQAREKEYEKWKSDKKEDFIATISKEFARKEKYCFLNSLSEAQRQALEETIRLDSELDQNARQTSFLQVEEG